MKADVAVDLAREIVGGCLEAGVREVVVCAGARNAALVTVLARTASLRLWSFPEERSAAFFALGRAAWLGQPVAVVTTSGTAAAEVLPATIEAFYQGVPLVLITADRPRRFRGTGAPQAIEQPGLLGPYVAYGCDVAGADEAAAIRPALSAWSMRRPVHLNVCFEEPEAEPLGRANGVVAPPEVRPHRGAGPAGALEGYLAREGTLVTIVAGLDPVRRQGVAGFLRRLGGAVCAEATSGLREDPGLAPQLVRGGEAGLAALGATRVLRIGGVPSVRLWRDLETREDVAVFSVSETGFSGLARASEVVGFPDWDAIAVTSAGADLGIDREIFGGMLATLARFPRSEPALVRALSAVIPERSLVFLGNSLPIREWDAFAVHTPRGLRCHANRGANGIDGCVSTFLGLGADEPESWCLIGDLAALYDLAAPWISRALAPGRRRLVVINNGGGRIFSRVKALSNLERPARDLMENPHALNFRGWAGLWGWDYRAVTTAAELSSPVEASHAIIEITPDATETTGAWNAIDGPDSVRQPTALPHASPLR